MGYSPRGHKESDTTERLNNNNNITVVFQVPQFVSSHFPNQPECLDCVKMHVPEKVKSFWLFFIFNDFVSPSSPSSLPPPWVRANITYICCLIIRFMD